MSNGNGEKNKEPSESKMPESPSASASSSAAAPSAKAAPLVRITKRRGDKPEPKDGYEQEILDAKNAKAGSSEETK